MFAGRRSLSSSAGEWVYVRDIYMPAKAATSLTIRGNCLNLFLPITGTMCLDRGNNATTDVCAEEVFCFGADVSTRIKITNPHPDETINFLHIAITDDDPLFYLPPALCRLNITSRNILSQGSGFAAHVFAGVYEKGVKDRFVPHQLSSSVLCYAICGSFEVTDRLLNHRDALYFWGAGEITFETLSEESIILFIECSPIK